PYRLLGWSFGGLVAHETARQLQADGERVTSLVILDAYPHTASFDPDIDGTAQHLADLVRQGTGHFAADWSDWDDTRIAAIIRNNLNLARAHQFGRFDGDLLLVIAAKGDRDTGGWRPYVSGDVVQTRLSCTHDELARPEMLGLVWDAVSQRLAADTGNALIGG